MTESSINPTKPKEGKDEEKPKEGRPPVWTSPEVIQKLINNYFENEKHPTLAGLAYNLDISRATLYNYEHKDEFLDIIKKARDRVLQHYENLLLYSDRPTGVIFALKNMGWADRIESNTDITSGGKPIPIMGGSSSVPRDNSIQKDIKPS